MSNFWQKQVAQESANAQLEPGSIELPEEAVETHIAEAEEDTAEIELLDRDGAVLADDADETDAQIDLVDEGEESGEDMSEGDVEALDVAQESIRKRWGIDRRSVAQESAGSSRARRVVARESLVDDAKTLVKRFIEWLKELGRKAKERWMKFHNAGKTIQGRSKKFEAKLRKLGTKNKDTISGGFIKQLSKGGEFIGTNMAEMKEQLAFAKNTMEAQTEIYASAKGTVDKILGGESGVASEVLGSIKSKGLKGTKVIGGMQIDFKEESESTVVEFTEDTSEVKEEVATPSSSELATLNDFYNLVGKDLEKQLQDFRKTEKAQADLEKVMDKVLAAIGKKEGEEGGEKQARVARKMAQSAASNAQLLAKAGAHVWKVLPSGINGYLAAGDRKSVV